MGHRPALAIPFPFQSRVIRSRIMELSGLNCILVADFRIIRPSAPLLLDLGSAEKVFRGDRVWGVGCRVLPILRGSIT
uniref:Similarity.Hypothetical start n=1 Tax=Microcystis aeruginosa (strain PCC 7806) TaxID=267872 RepID=A8YDY8_MICA7|nr:unnamed protein product [Microcystis aeruginosa PCC 7806]